MNILKSFLRRFRVNIKIKLGIEPKIKIMKGGCKLEFHGNKDYGGWAIPKNIINKNSIVLDIGIGEDISFSESIILKYNINIHGFDPTPKSIIFINKLNNSKFHMHNYGLAAKNGTCVFHLPANTNYVSGSLTKAIHMGDDQIQVNFIDVENLMLMLYIKKIDVLKIDIEGAEYEVIESEAFKRNAHRINIICVEFHHRWPEFTASSTILAVIILERLGFECVWRAAETNEEFTFKNKYYNI